MPGLEVLRCPSDYRGHPAAPTPERSDVEVGFPGHPAYAAAKGGMVALTRQLAVEYGPELRVNAVLPGPIRTAIWDAIDADYIDLTERSVPAARLGTATEVAKAIAFLASDDASYVSGASLLVDGGFTAQKDPR